MLKLALIKSYGTRHDLVNHFGRSLSHMTTDMSLCRNYNPVLSTFNGFVTRVTQRVPLVEEEVLPFLQHLRQPLVFSWIRVVPSLLLCVVYCRSLFFVPFLLAKLLFSIFLYFNLQLPITRFVISFFNLIWTTINTVQIT